MTPHKRREDTGRGPPEKALVAALLILATLVCHGVMGPVHQLSGSGGLFAVDAAAGVHADHAGGQHGADPDGSHLCHDLGSVDYAAAYLALLFLGLVLGLLLRGDRLWKRSASISGAAASPQRPVLRPPPPVTAPYLQVFRL